MDELQNQNLGGFLGIRCIRSVPPPLQYSVAVVPVEEIKTILPRYKSWATAPKH